MSETLSDELCDVCKKPLEFPADNDPEFAGDTMVTSRCRHMIQRRTYPVAPKPQEERSDPLPCPCCGTEAHFGEVSDGGHFIECMNPACMLTTKLVYPLKESAVPKLLEMWNRRGAALHESTKESNL